jgi:enoyl-CoA hydratase/carnithine racemase
MQTIVLSGRGPNMLSLELLENLEAEIEKAAGEPLLITGAGEAFSSGLDLDALQSVDADGLTRLLGAMDRSTRALFHYPAPTVALVNGHAIAGGCLLVQACDVRVAVDSPKTRIGMTGVAIGLIYPPFVHDVFRYRLAPAQAEHVLLSADRFHLPQALALGLIDEIVPTAGAQARAEALLEARSRLPRRSYAATKRSLRSPAPPPEEARRAFEESVLPSWTRTLLR